MKVLYDEGFSVVQSTNLHATLPSEHVRYPVVTPADDMVAVFCEDSLSGQSLYALSSRQPLENLSTRNFN